MRNRIFGAAAVVALSVVWLEGCSSSKDEDNVSNGSGGGLSLLPDGAAATGSDGSSDMVGGFVEKTDAEVDALENAACTGWTAEPESIPALLMIVVDTSRSMDYPASQTVQETKWAVTAAALDEAIDSIPASTPVGLMFYPNSGIYTASTPAEITQCVDVSSLVAVAPDQRAALHAAIAAVTPNGCTPTHGAYQYGLESGLRVAQYPGDKYMLLITDGQPTLTVDCMGSCNPADPVSEQPIIDEITAAFALDGTRTFVIGSPGSERNETTGEDVRGWLSRAAVEGGTATDGCQVNGPNFCHFDMSVADDFGAALRAALSDITGQIVQCSYGLPAPPPGETVDLGAVNLIVSPSDGTNKLMLQSGVQDCSQGWYYDDDGRVNLCADSCGDVEADPGASLKLFFGCQTESGPIT